MIRTPRLSVVVPVYNEERTIDETLDRLACAPLAHPDQQVVVVDDASTDGTAARLLRRAGEPGLTLARHRTNRGKGAAVRTGLALAAGAVVAVQDADLEYDPADLAAVVGPVLRGECIVAYGVRYPHNAPGGVPSKYRVAGVALGWMVRALYGVRLSDVTTCYKAMPADLYRDLGLSAERFAFCAEVTAKVCRIGHPILEVPVSYRPRTRAQGKKIGWPDAFALAATLVAWRFRRLPASCGGHRGTNLQPLRSRQGRSDPPSV